MTIGLIIVVILLVAGLVSQRALGERMRRFYDRRCVGRAWRTQFPDAKNEEIRDFLALFVDSFALSKKKKLSFAPDDKVMDVYRAIYPQVGGADALECETLVMQCEERYGVDITRGFRDSTRLGDLFREVQKRA